MLTTRILLMLALAGTAAHAQTRSLSAVLPPGKLNLAGDGNTPIPWRRTAGRTMLAYGANTLDQTRPVRVVGVAFRPKESSIVTTTWDLSLDVSTARRSPAVLSSRFDSNHGLDRRRVFDGSHRVAGRTFSALPYPFVSQIRFTRPFDWDPSCGALLLDIRVRSKSGTGWEVDDQTAGSQVGYAVVHTSDPNATTANFSVRPGAPVLQLILESHVVPKQFETSEANSGTTVPWMRAANSGVRVQYAYEGNEFGFSEPLRITRLGWRLNHGNVSYGQRTYDLRVTLSTGRRELTSSMSTTFAENEGPDAAVVYDGLWTPPSIPAEHFFDPAKFALELPLERAFTYDPRDGSLVVDVVVRSATNIPTSAGFDMHTSSSHGIARVWSTNPSSRTASVGPQRSGIILALGGVPALSDELRTTLPTRLARSEGSSATSWPFWRSSSMRVMYAYGSDTVDRTEPMRIAGIAFRPDTSLSSIPASAWAFRLEVSTGTRAPSAMSRTFDLNHGSDRTIAYASLDPLEMPAQDLGAPPRDFLLRVPFRDAFVWDPAKGPLVLDFRMQSRASGGFGGFVCDAIFGDGTESYARIAHQSDSTASVADSGPQRAALVTELLLDTDVVPARARGEDANSSSPYPWAASGPCRVMSIYGPEEFDFREPGRHRISELAWRPDAASTAVFPRGFDVRVSLSTGEVLVSQMSDVYDQNHGSDRLVVFDGTWTVPSIVLECADVQPFVLRLPLQREFEYDPAAGPLVVDIQVRSAVGVPLSNGLDVATTTGGFGTQLREIIDRSDAFATRGELGVSRHALALAVNARPVWVLPASASRADAIGFSSVPFQLSGASRTLMAYLPSVLGVNPTEPIEITGLSWRPDASAGAIETTTFQARIDLSTGITSPRSLSLTFDSNHGNDRTRVFDGEFGVARAQVGDVDDFVLAVDLDRPFRWDPYNGPLVVDLAVLGSTGGPLGGPIDVVSSTAVGRAYHLSSATATTATTAQTIAPVLALAGPSCNALAKPFGSGCGGLSGVPLAATRGLPAIPNPTFAFTVDTARASAAAALLLGFSRTSISLDLLGFRGCKLLTPGDIAVVSLVTDSQGEADFPLPIVDSWLADRSLFAQWALLDPTAPGSLAMSGGIEAVLRR